MAADQVTIFSKGANLIAPQKTLLANLSGSDKEMPGPAIFLEQTRYARGSALPAIVKSQEKWELRIIYLGELVRLARRSIANRRDGGKMGLKF